MNKITIMTFTALALVAACTKPTPICDREAQEWSKFGTQEDVCATPPSVVVAQPINWDHDDKGRTERPTNVSLPTLHEGPTSPPDGPENEPEDEPDTPDGDDDGPKNDGPKDNKPKDKPKGDNSDANGSGGNKHDRDDFTHEGTEVAEGKKND